MNEKDKQFENVVRALYPPFLYFMITLFVEVIVDIYLFFKQAGAVTDNGADFLSSYRFFDLLEENLEQYTYLITLIGAVIAAVLFGIIYIRECSLSENNIVRQLKFADGKIFLLLIGLGFFGSTGLGRFVSLLPLDNVIGNYEATSNNLLKGHLVMQILSLGIIVPVAEELIYRGLVFSRMKKFLDTKIAMVIVSALFGVFHFNLLQGVYAFLLSILLIWVYVRYQSVFACIIIHSVANITSVFSNYFNILEVFNKNLFVYLFIMTVELAAAAVIFLLVMNGEDDKTTQSTKHSGTKN